MEIRIFLLFCSILFCFTTCVVNSSDSLNIKHTCFVFDVDRKPISGKRVRYFETRTINASKFNDPGFVSELITDKTGKVVFTGTTDQTSIDVVAETDSTSQQINALTANNTTDSLFIDKLIPFKMRIRSAPAITGTYIFRSVRIVGTTNNYQLPELLLFKWESRVPRKTPFDTLISTKILEKGSCKLEQTSQLETQKNADYRPFNIPISFSQDSTYLVELWN